MAQKLCPFSGRQFLDSSGDPYVGAQLFVYVAGSSTKQTVTKDSAGSSAHTNPIILNARGEPGDGAGASQAIWQPEGVVVDLVLAPANDTDPPVSAISTWPNLAGINDTTVTIDQWISGPEPTYVDTTSFTLVGDQTSDFHVGRRVKTTNSGGTIYSSIITSAYTSLTTITVINYSGTLDSGLSAVSYGIISSTNSSAPAVINHAMTFSETVTLGKSIYEKKGADIASANDTILLADGNYNDITGTTTTNGMTDGIQNELRSFQYDDAVLLKHDTAASSGFSSLSMPNDADYTTAAGDVFAYRYNDTHWEVAGYVLASGQGIVAIKPSSQLDDTITTEGSQAISTSSSWTPSAGFYNMVGSINGISLQIYVSGSWRGLIVNTSTDVTGTFFCDGTNMRIYNSNASSNTVYWQRFDG